MFSRFRPDNCLAALALLFAAGAMAQPGEVDAGSGVASADGGVASPDGGPPLTAVDAGVPPGSYNYTETFERFAPGSPPEGFLYRRTGKGLPARWQIREVARAPSPTHVMAQVDADRTDPRYPQALLDNYSIRDVRLSARCRVLSGRDERSCGLVLRHKSEKAYYLVRLSVRDSNVCLLAVEEDGQKKIQRREIACAPATLALWRWFGLTVSAKKNHLVVSLSGKQLLEVDDATYPDAARVGLWTGNDSVAEFDDVRADQL